MDSTSGFTKEKLKILKETELEKLKRINECKVFYQKKNLIQDEIQFYRVQNGHLFRENTRVRQPGYYNMSNELDEETSSVGWHCKGKGEVECGVGRIT